MERDLNRLARLLRQVAHDAGLALLCRHDADALRHCARQYNRVRAHLGTLDPAFARLFGPLPDDAPAGDVRLLARALALYVEEKHRRAHGGPALLGWLADLCALRLFPSTWTCEVTHGT